MINKPQPKKSEFNVTSKLRLQDALLWKPKNRTISYLIENQPIELWNRIHQKKGNNRKVSLVRTAYAMLKGKVRKLDPSLVEKVEKEHLQHKAKRILKKELKKGSASLVGKRFKKIASRKVIE